MQDGSFFHSGKKWYLRYYVRTLDGAGKPVQKKACKQLGPWNGEEFPPESIKRYAREILQPENAEVKTDALMTFVDYVDAKYIPACERTQRPATLQSTRDAWKLLRPHVPVGLTLRDFGPAAGRAILNAVHQEKKRSKYVYTRLKFFLYGALEFAISLEIIGNKHSGWGNPMQSVKPPEGIAPKRKRTYTTAQEAAIIKALDEPVRTIVLLAASTGLRKSEIQGLCWEDLNISDAGSTLTVRRTVYFGRKPKLQAGGAVYILPYSIGETKTEASNAEVPIDNNLLAALLAMRPANARGWIFKSKHGPRHLSNLESVHIKPTLAKAGLEWYGWHAFRHAFATRLNEQEGATPKVAQGLMRHADANFTLNKYTRNDVKAMRRASESLASDLEGAMAKA